MSTVELEHTLEAEEALNESLQQHAGQWVAISASRVIASASTLGELLDLVEGRDDVELLEVPAGDCTVSFF